eukprot:848590-Rhodomonas_salina.1
MEWEAEEKISGAFIAFAYRRACPHPPASWSTPDHVTPIPTPRDPSPPATCLPNPGNVTLNTRKRDRHPAVFLQPLRN